MLRVLLDGQDFRDLVAGRDVVKSMWAGGATGVQLRLSDIGFDVMRVMIDEAEAAQRKLAEAEA